MNFFLFNIRFFKFIDYWLVSTKKSLDTIFFLFNNLSGKGYDSDANVFGKRNGVLQSLCNNNLNKYKNS